MVQNYKNITELENSREAGHLYWWNVVVEMPDGSIKFTYSRGHEYNNALVWFDNATYLKASSDRKRIIELLNNPSKTYDEFCQKEEELKKKYNVK